MDIMVQNKLQKFTKFLIRIGLLIALLGILAIAYPAGFGKVTAVVMGIFILVAGSFRLVFSIWSPSMGSLILRNLFAFLMVFVGIWIIANPDMGLESLTIVMAVYFIADGITEIVYSFSLMPVGGGVYMLLNGIISVVIGILIFSKWPESSNYALGVYLGVKLLIDGMMLTFTGYAIRKSSEIS